jgi:hypothetical protein
MNPVKKVDVNSAASEQMTDTEEAMLLQRASLLQQYVVGIRMKLWNSQLLLIS